MSKNELSKSLMNLLKRYDANEAYSKKDLCEKIGIDRSNWKRFLDREDYFTPIETLLALVKFTNDPEWLDLVYTKSNARIIVDFVNLQICKSDESIGKEPPSSRQLIEQNEKLLAERDSYKREFLRLDKQIKKNAQEIVNNAHESSKKIQDMVNQNDEFLRSLILKDTK